MINVMENSNHRVFIVLKFSNTPKRKATFSISEIDFFQVFEKDQSTFFKIQEVQSWKESKICSSGIRSGTISMDFIK